MGGSASATALERQPAWWAALVLAFGLMLLLNPAGFIGGGNDDWQYLHAAQCLREHGLCLPRNHWEARWPVVAPIAFMTSLLGESRLSVSIAPAIASFCAIILLALVGNRLFARPVGWLSAFLLLLTPAFSTQLTEPSVEATELCVIFAGLLALLQWQSKQRLLWAALAGILFGLAVQVRETAIVAAPFALGFVCLARPKPRLADLAAAAAAFAIPFLVVFAWFAVSTGDPLYRAKLSMSHTRIWSSELLGPIDRDHLPFFNKSYIANWRMQPGIHVHWAIDGLLNLLVNAIGGLSFPIVTLALLFGRRTLGAVTSRRVLILWLVAIAYMASLIYALAVDPKARMMLVPLSLMSVAMVLVTVRLVQAGFPLVAYSLWLASAIVGIALHYSHQRTYYIEAAARRWIAERPGKIETEFATRKYLALVPSAQRLPGLEADKPFLLLTTSIPCRQWIEKGYLPAGSLSVVASRKNTAIQLPSIGGELCLLEYQRPIPGPVIADAIKRYRLEDRRTFVEKNK